MAPPKHEKRSGIVKSTLMPLARKGISTRSQASTAQDQNVAPIVTRGKRKAEASSPLRNDKVKRSALGNLTNNVIQPQPLDDLIKLLTKDDVKSKNTAQSTKIKPPPQKNRDLPNTKIQTRAASKTKNGTAFAFPPPAPPPPPPPPPPMPPNHRKTTKKTETVTKPSTTTTTTKTNLIKTTKDITENTTNKPTTRRISNEFEKTEDSLYMSALEDPSLSSIRLSGAFELTRRSLTSSSEFNSRRDSYTSETTISWTIGNRIASPSPVKYEKIPDNIADFDRENWDDPFQVAHYAMDIFEYLKRREKEFFINDYMPKQCHLSKWMRSLLIDWMVEVQETFELNHETLYLGVKLVDIYLMDTIIIKDKLQLLGAAALFIACKYDERTPPLVEDFLYICDGAYAHNELIKMEMSVLRAVNFDLGIPLSYRFLRRYGRCARVPMPTLTLARYILELSLMDYATVSLSDSQLAAATLFIALRMNGVKKAWNDTLEYYSGYKLIDFAHIILILNSGLHRKPRESMKTVRNKYSHKIFHEVTKVPLLTWEKLFEYTGLLGLLVSSPSLSSE